MSNTLRELIRECIHAELLEARTLMGIDLTDLSIDEIEEVELYLSGNISLDSIESPVVKNRVRDMQLQNKRRTSDVFSDRQSAGQSTIVRRPSQGSTSPSSTTPPLSPPSWSGKLHGQTYGKREGKVDTGRAIFTRDAQGRGMRLPIKEKQYLPGYWIWDAYKGKWVTDSEFHKSHGGR